MPGREANSSINTKRERERERESVCRVNGWQVKWLAGISAVLKTNAE